MEVWLCMYEPSVSSIIRCTMFGKTSFHRIFLYIPKCMANKYCTFYTFSHILKLFFKPKHFCNFFWSKWRPSHSSWCRLIANLVEYMNNKFRYVFVWNVAKYWLVRIWQYELWMSRPACSEATGNWQYDMEKLCNKISKINLLHFQMCGRLENAD